ncbi:MAG: arsenic efflux protein [Ignavibacterium sp.]|nr:MAG: arsenic efflux protein [Ignavibacterium sp.]
MIIEILEHSLLITAFVFIMMLLVEYLNVQTKGSWQQKLKQSKNGQYLLGVILGAIPGCLGAFTVVSLYSHGIVSFGALVATMIATSGDEAYVMLSMFPLKAILLIAFISVIGFAVGIIVDKVYKKQDSLLKRQGHALQLHKEELIEVQPKGLILKQLKEITIQRTLLITILSFFLILILTGFIEIEGWQWIRITLLVSNLFALFVVITVPDHFLEIHLWEHVLKRHLLRIFLWTLGALAVIHILGGFINLEAWIGDNTLMVLLIAVLVGLIPESGPHLIFVTLFASGSIPISILLASSIVQDGHGTLPLLAVSKRSFIILKLINLLVGFSIGFVFLMAGY